MCYVLRLDKHVKVPGNIIYPLGFPSCCITTGNISKPLYNHQAIEDSDLSPISNIYNIYIRRANRGVWTPALSAKESDLFGVPSLY